MIYRLDHVRRLAHLKASTMQAVTQPAGEGWSPQSHGGRVVQYPPDPSGKDTAFPPPEYICNDGKVELLAQQTLLHITPVRACSSSPSS